MSEQEVRPIVLVVDDDALARELTVRMLGSLCEVVEADSIQAAQPLLERHAVDVVVLDVMMPDVSGLEGCRTLKAAVPRYLPVILLTALQSQDDRNLGLSSGADDYLSKPVNKRELQLRVAAFTRASRQDRTIRSQMEQLRELSALKDDLVQVLVHDLRNPLSAVTSAFGLLESSGVITDEEDRLDLQTGLSAAKRMAVLLDELLQVRLLEEGKLALKKLPTSISGVVRDAIDTLRPGATQLGVRVAFEAPTSDTTIPADGALLQRAIENLLSNAVKYTKQEVEVRLDDYRQSLEISVSDRGPGIPELMRPQLFEKFGSLEAARGEQRRGIGLGLYMVRLVAAAHGGGVLVQPRPGGGSVFRLSLTKP